MLNGFSIDLLKIYGLMENINEIDELKKQMSTIRQSQCNKWKSKGSVRIRSIFCPC